MSDNPQVSRRTILYGTAIAAGSVMLAACSGGGGSTPGSGGNTSGTGGTGGAVGGKGSAKEPLPVPATFKESPLLKAQADSGAIPPIKDRLPEKPLVVPHNWVQEGKYGGKMQMLAETTSGDRASSIGEFFCGHKIIRFINDGLDIIPGLAESWEMNADASEWTFHFRKGLKWSDGEPWTTADIMFWWDDIVINEEHTEVAPDEARSGKNTLAKFEAVDEVTLKMTFDAPAPLTAQRIAMWVNGPMQNGPWWMVPAHYAKQFHPKYNKSAPKNWAAAGGAFETKVDFTRNADCPTMAGWRVKNYREAQSITFERNPYYYVVTKEGSQLPFIDEVVFTAVQDPEVGKLRMQQGGVDYVQGQFMKVGLSDISTFRQTEKQSGLDLLLWDGGSGTSSMWFVNYDVKDPELRKVFRDPKFRQALSLAFNREEAQKAIYFEQGELTSGTLSPKAKEYLVNDQGKQAYQEWRDAWVKYDPEAAKKLLDEIGVVDKDGDGLRELPSGKKLKLSIDYSANADPEHIAKDNLLLQNWKAIGVDGTTNPISPEGFNELWDNGSLMVHSNWEVGDGPNHLLYPQWLVPLEQSRWAPLEGRMYSLRGTAAETQQLDRDPFARTPPRMEAEKGGPIEQLWNLYDKTKLEPDELKRTQSVWDMIKIHVEHGPFFSGTVANTPRVILKKKDLKNVPAKENLQLGGFANPWIHPTPSVYDVETYYWDNPDQHA
ncbi:ABC transporter substrate-binding protein [Tenggerimyces flavus]|uniref:ABC transporter substrate-binding protein n=1 Tax=Tenggerimyces flavus TaxID=1708749 RepID=A0ABV7Y7P7_9ACTN|nr:ABC transporter substrate-binding protein [Tenggerimyces flavus]MBM7785527.1 peptide/nickel transport system substrate-binding protein [Tenggerimyces flavus]